MGVSKSGKQLGRKFQRTIDDFDDLTLAQVKEASQIIKTEVTRRAPKKLSGVGKRGARIGVRYNVDRFGDAFEAKSLVFATGPFHLIERPTEAHRIPKAEVGRGRRRRANTALIVVPGAQQSGRRGPRGVRRFAHVKGTKGKYPWRRGNAAAEDDVRRVLTSKTATVIRRNF
jgi:hypothetical protein